ncbi:hypothetical protein SISNIDRAFT_551121 [Sistotremastrum niveocremeum HHB9708]|uniref:Uncharacterized protein n=1 Tax=Sistotremastrum niveocremeum HHB9708 TaxID=1314777 RepID=A0A164SC51_9AGAM|nr:hypothetical protein SISNIDRAFT_551121 [Sistotremastrum niveocremeum HHB9708]
MSVPQPSRVRLDASARRAQRAAQRSVQRVEIVEATTNVRAVARISQRAAASRTAQQQEAQGQVAVQTEGEHQANEQPGVPQIHPQSQNQSHAQNGEQGIGPESADGVPNVDARWHLDGRIQDVLQELFGDEEMEDMQSYPLQFGSVATNGPWIHGESQDVTGSLGVTPSRGVLDLQEPATGPAGPGIGGYVSPQNSRWDTAGNGSVGSDGLREPGTLTVPNVPQILHFPSSSGQLPPPILMDVDSEGDRPILPPSGPRLPDQQVGSPSHVISGGHRGILGSTTNIPSLAPQGSPSHVQSANTRARGGNVQLPHLTPEDDQQSEEALDAGLSDDGSSVISSHSIFVNPLEEPASDGRPQMPASPPTPQQSPSPSPPSTPDGPWLGALPTPEVQWFGPLAAGLRRVAAWIQTPEGEYMEGPLEVPTGPLMLSQLWETIIAQPFPGNFVRDIFEFRESTNLYTATSPVAYDEDFDAPHRHLTSLCSYPQASACSDIIWPADAADERVQSNIRSMRHWPMAVPLYVIYLLPHHLRNAVSRALSNQFESRVHKIIKVAYMSKRNFWGFAYTTILQIGLVAMTTDDLHISGPSAQGMVGNRIPVTVSDIRHWVGLGSNARNMNTFVRECYECMAYMDTLDSCLEFEGPVLRTAKDQGLDQDRTV